ncbi:MAG: aminotransferase class IV [Nostocoides sp.]
MNDDVRVWVDGELNSGSQARIGALDHAVTVGDAAFETLKIVDGTPFATSRHLRRMQRTLAGLGLPPADGDRIAEGIAVVLSVGDPIAFGRLRYTVSSGAGPLGSDRGGAPLTYIVTASPAARPPGTAAIVTVPWTRNERAATAGLKTTSYAENVIALAYAHQRGAIEAIFANTREQLCEATGSNIFLVRAGQILTPSLAAGCLAGVTRELTIEWARSAGMTVLEEDVSMQEAHFADEVFLTSTTKDVLGVHAWDERTYEAPGPVTAGIAEVFAMRAAAGMDP